MSTKQQSNNKLILAIVLSVLTYWLFAQSFINISTQVQHTYQTTPGVVNLSVSLASFATGIFMVGAGDVSDKIGKLKIVLALAKYRFWNLNFCYGSDIA